MMCQHKRRDAVRRIIAPPSFPRIVRPCAANRAEHITAQNPGAYILHSSLGPLIVNARRATLMPVHLLPGLRREKPLEQLRSTEAERILDALVSAGSVAIERYSEGVDANYWAWTVSSIGDSHEPLLTWDCKVSGTEALFLLASERE